MGRREHTNAESCKTWWIVYRKSFLLKQLAARGAWRGNVICSWAGALCTNDNDRFYPVVDRSHRRVLKREMTFSDYFFN